MNPSHYYIGYVSMKHKLTHVIAGTLLSACMGITYAGETPRTLGCIEYKVLSKQEMASITGGGGGSSASGGGIESWRTNPPVSVNGTKVGAGVEV
jgi:bacteriocin-like protein